MTVSVIIPTKNEEKNIGNLLKSLTHQSFKNFEIIVVDNHSQDRTLQIAKKFTKKVYLKGPERSAQRNFGLQKAKGRYVLFLDADMQPGKNILKECLEKIQNKKIRGVLIDEESIGENFLSRVKNLEKKIYRGKSEIEAPRFFRKKDLLKIGGYDENLISGEDWDLTLRIRGLGQFSKINSKIRHFENHSFWQDISKKYYYAKNIRNYAQKHPEEFSRQSGFNRILILFKNPKIIYKNLPEFFGLVLLKTGQFLAYQISKIQAL